MSYLWEVQKIEADGTLTDFPINLNTATTGDRSRYLVVKEGALENSHAYEFKLRVIISNSAPISPGFAILCLYDRSLLTE